MRNQFPMISIITPSLNCGAYIEQCIQSVLVQNYSNFEHIIMDGGSQDETVEILKKYPHLRWISEPDRGEADALNKALKMTQGDIIAWLNADDYYLEGVFERVSQEVIPSQNRHVIYGGTHIIDNQGRVIRTKGRCSKISLVSLLRFWRKNQPPHQFLNFRQKVSFWFYMIVSYPWVRIGMALGIRRHFRGLLFKIESLYLVNMSRMRR